MTNPAADARANAQERWPGATVFGRGRNNIRHQHPSEPDRFMLDAAIAPIHYGVGEDQEIDTAWQPTTGAWNYEMTKNNWQTFAKATFNVGDIFEFQTAGEWVRFDPQSLNWIDENTSRQQIAIKQAVAAIVNDDVIEFPEGYGPGRHFQYQNQTARLQKLITIDADTDLPAVTLQGNTIWFEAEFTIAHSSGIEVYLDGQLWQKQNNVRVQTSDRIEFKDEATGQTVFWSLDFPRAFGSLTTTTEGEPSNEVIGQMEVRRQGSPTSLFITVRIPKVWIDTATFPIYIDPSIDEQVGAGFDDAHDTSWTFENNNNDLNVVAATSESGRWDTGARFQTVDVAQGVTVDTGSYVEAYCVNNNINLNCHIYGEDVDDSNDFNTTQNVRSRTRTTANVDWDETLTNNSWEGSDVEIQSILQEIFGRGSWAANNNLTILLIGDNASTENAQFRSYDGNTTLAPKLHIEYTAAGGGDSTPYLNGLRTRRMQPLIVR